MNGELFVIDGTNLINILSVNTKPDERKLTPLLKLLLALLDNNASFFCYFDASTRFMFREGSMDRQMYDIIIGIRISDYFQQTKGGVQADKLILQQADAINGRIISMDNFTQFYEEYPWLEMDADYRLIQADIIQGLLRVDKLDLKLPLEQKVTKESTIELINRLEGERGNLNGIIKKYDQSRRFGLIKRAVGGPTLLFHRNQVIDDNLDYTIIGQSVRFNVGIRHSKQKNMYDFCAINIEAHAVESGEATDSLEERLQYLEMENVQLSELNAGLKKRNRELNNDVHDLQGVADEQEEVIIEKDHRIMELEDEIRRLKEQHQEEKATLQQTIDKNKEESDELAIALDFQEQKIRSLDFDLKEMLRLYEHNKIDPTEVILYEKLKQNYKLLQHSVKQKDARIIFLRNNIQVLQDELEHTDGTTNNARQEIESLKSKIEALEQTNFELQSRIKSLNAPVSRPKVKVEKKVERPKKRVLHYKKATSKELLDWWYDLEPQWQKAFNKAVFSRGEMTQLPSEEELRTLLKNQHLEIIGEGIFFSNFKRLSYRLTNLSGVQALSQLKSLNLSGHALTSFKDINGLHQLETINFTSNAIEAISHLGHLKHLKALILRDNKLINLNGAAELAQLEFLDCSNNQELVSIEGVEQLKNLKTLQVGYAPALREQIKVVGRLMPQMEIKNY